MIETDSEKVISEKKFPKISLAPVTVSDLLDTDKVKKHSNEVNELYISDIQSLIIKVIFNQMCKVVPRWCKFQMLQSISGINLIVVEGVSQELWNDFLLSTSNSKSFQKRLGKFVSRLNQSINFVDSISYGIPWRYELFQIPSFLIYRRDTLKRTSRDFDCSTNSKPAKLIKLQTDQIEDEYVPGTFDKFPRTELLLNEVQMEFERVPMLHHLKELKDFKQSKPLGYEPVTDRSPIFALDCEMVGCESIIDPKAEVSELAAITVVNEQREIVYQTYVKPDSVIKNYRTPWSGVSSDTLENVTTSVADVQAHIATILPADAILTGHSISNDLHAMKIYHPYLIDTSEIFRIGTCGHRKNKLQHLSDLYLKRSIQTNNHDSFEDALATIDLVLLKLSKDLEFGDVRWKIERKLQQQKHEQQEASYAHSGDIQVTVNYLPLLPVCTFKANHLTHRQTISSQNQANTMIPLIDSLNNCPQTPFSMKTVASISESWTEDIASIEQEPWFPTSFGDFLAEQKRFMQQNGFTTTRQHPFNVSIVDCTHLQPKQLPSKKWMTRLLKRVVAEFDKCPEATFCGLMFIDGRLEHAVKTNSGKLYFGITPTAPSAE